MLKRTIVVAMLSALQGGAMAQNVCDVALKSGAFNTTDLAQTTAIVQKAKEDVCNSEYNSASEAVSAAQASGANIGVGGYTLGASDAKATASGKFSVKDSKFCSAKAEELDSFTSVRARKQIADSALAAWTKCIETTNRDQLFVAYTPLSDGTGMTGILRRKVTNENANFGTIEGISTTATGAMRTQVSCRVGTTEVKPDTKVSIPINRTKIAITCSKPATQTIAISLNATVGDQEWIYLNSAERADQLKQQTLQDALNAQKRELMSSNERIADLSRKLAAVEASPALEQVRQQLSQRADALQAAIGNTDSRVSAVDGKVRWKANNDGSASCVNYCRGANYENWAGVCLAAVVGANVLESCAKANYGGPVHCLCAAH